MTPPIFAALVPALLKRPVKSVLKELVSEHVANAVSSASSLSESAGEGGHERGLGQEGEGHSHGGGDETFIVDGKTLKGLNSKDELRRTLQERLATKGLLGPGGKGAAGGAAAGASPPPNPNKGRPPKPSSMKGFGK
jgi:hypothetical protein